MDDMFIKKKTLIISHKPYQARQAQRPKSQQGNFKRRAGTNTRTSYKPISMKQMLTNFELQQKEKQNELVSESEGVKPTENIEIYNSHMA